MQAYNHHCSTEGSSITTSEPIEPCSDYDQEIIEHDMKLYIADAYGIEIPNSEFDITITIVKEQIKTKTTYGIKNLTKVTLQLPAINFVTGPYANSKYELNNPITEPSIGTPAPVFIPAPNVGGYVYTKAGYLPDGLRPNELLTRAFFGPSNNGMNLPFVYIPNLSPTPTTPLITAISYTPPQAGYLIRITNTGGLVIEGTSTFANIIPPGIQQLLPTTLPAYIVKPNLRVGDNTKISTGAINIVQYGYPPNPPRTEPPTPAFTATEDYVRDHHVNDAFDNVVAYAWADNSNISDPVASPGVMNLAYAIGKVKDGKLKMHKAQFLPNPLNLFVFDTAIAINRSNKKNIVISYLLIDSYSPSNGKPLALVCAAVSFDGGKTWPINGPTNVQPTGNTGDSFPGYPTVPGGSIDNPGVRADKFGNFWYGSTNAFDDFGNETNVPFFMISSDMGQSWTLAYTIPYDAANPIFLFDYPSMCFGGDGQGNYGLHINVDYLPNYLINGDPNKAIQLRLLFQL